jgi:D-alanine-D-alanine ligase
MTIALVYNIKAEAPLQTASPTGQPRKHSSDHPSPATFGLSPTRVPDFHIASGVERANDLYVEWDTFETVNAVRLALEERHDVVMIEADQDAYRKIVEFRPDFAFNMSEGLYGASREAQIPALLEMLRVPYLGSDPLTLALCLDKSRAKEILSYHGIPTPAFRVIRSVSGCRAASVRFPAIVKPLHEGSSKGVYNSCLVRDLSELEREVAATISTYQQPALVEDFLPGREFTVAILGNGDGLRVLPIVEIRFNALPKGVNHMYSYEAKWVWDRSESPLDIFACPADLDPHKESEIERICRETYRVLNCRDWARIDVRLDKDARPSILEVNPLPGILPRPEDNSCFPKAARAAGMSYNQLINAVLDIALERCGMVEHESFTRARAGVSV